MKLIRKISMLMLIVFVISTLCTYSIFPVYAAEEDSEDVTSTETDETTEATDGEENAEDGAEGDAEGDEDEFLVSDHEALVKRYLNNKYYTPEDKLTLDENLEKMFSKNGYAIYVNKLTGEVVVQNELTGQNLFSNPYDVGTITASSATKEQLLSQVAVQFKNNGASTTYYSFTQSAIRDQIKVRNIKNGVRVEYALGREDGRILVPRMISAERFESIFLNPLTELKAQREAAHDGVAKGDDGYELDIIWFECDRFLNYFTKMDMNDPSLSTRGVKEMAAKYPIVKKMAIYVCDENVSEKELNVLEQYLKKYVPSYSYEDLDTDHSITNYTGADKAPPLFRLALEYTIDENGLSVRLPAKGLRYDATEYTLNSVTVLPYMGAGNYNNEGYTFLPDGSGSLFRFEDFAGDSVTITSQMYGQDYGFYQIGEEHREVMRLPVYGIVENIDKEYEVELSPAVLDKNGNVSTPAVTETRYYKEDRGFLAIIEAGDAIAKLTTNHGGALHSYCSAYASFTPRPSDSYNISDIIAEASSGTWNVTSARKYVGDITLRYVMLTSEDVADKNNLSKDDYYETSYVGMAAAYRDYLEREGVLTRITEEEADENIPIYIETFGTLETTDRILSIPVTVKKALTTFDNIKTMYDEFSAKGVSNINFKLTGFTNGGMYDYTGPTKVKWESAAGGSSGFKELTEYATEKGFGVYPDFNFTDTHTGGGMSKDYLVKTVSSRYNTKMVYDSAVQAYMPYGGLVVSAGSYDKIYTKFNKAYSKYNWDSVSVSTLASDLSTDFDKEDPHTREDSKEFTVEMLEKIRNDYANVMADCGNIYSVKYVDHLVNVPIDSSRYTLSSESVPFIGMVYHGYVNIAGTPINQAGDLDYVFLKNIENGANLYYTLAYQNTMILKEYPELSKYYSVRYEIWFDDVVETYLELNENLASLQTELIVDHEFLIGERVPDADEVEADKLAAEEEAKLIEDALAKYDAELARAIEFAQRKGTYTANFEEDYKAKNYPLNEDGTLKSTEEENPYADYITEEVADDDEGGYNYTKYTCDDGSIVRVTYSDGTTFILNYNMFEVTVEVDGKTVTVSPYGYVVQ